MATSTSGLALGSAATGRLSAPATRTLVRLARDPVAAVALLMLSLVVLCAVFAPLIAPYKPNAINPFNTLRAPSSAHLLGTDQNGRDVLSRVIYGSRVSLTVGFISVGIAVMVGVPLGLISGYAGRLTDALIMRLMDAILAFPALILALAIVAIAIGVTSVPVFARLVRAQTLSLKELDYALAARAMGAPAHRILSRHILPNTLAPIIVQASLGMAFAILAEAGLSYLGVGVKPPTATWGGMLQTALQVITKAPALSIFPGVAIFVTVLALNLVGDALRDILDPRLRGRLQSGR
jgi:peptide/nickel transport system permease protein